MTRDRFTYEWRQVELELIGYARKKLYGLDSILDAEDLVQDVAVTLYSNHKKLSPENFRALAFTTLKLVIKSRWSTMQCKGRTAKKVGLEHARKESIRLPDALVALDVQRALNRLKIKKRLVAMLTWMYGCTRKEVSRALSVGEATQDEWLRVTKAQLNGWLQ